MMMSSLVGSVMISYCARIFKLVKKIFSSKINVWQGIFFMYVRVVS